MQERRAGAQTPGASAVQPSPSQTPDVQAPAVRQREPSGCGVAGGGSATTPASMTGGGGGGGGSTGGWYPEAGVGEGGIGCGALVAGQAQTNTTKRRRRWRGFTR